MKNNGSHIIKGITVATVIGFLATGITILCVPIILTASNTRSQFFWNRILWAEFLAVLVWAYIGGFFSLVIPKNRSIRGLGAIMPALGVIIFFYAISSLIVMIAAAYFPQIGYLNTVSQIYKTAGLIIIIVFFFFSWIAGTADTEPIPDEVYTPQELAMSLQREENMLISQIELVPTQIKDKFNTFIICLKNIRERVQYSIPHVGRIGTDKGFILFANTVTDLCDECSCLNLQLLDDDKLQSLISKASSLNNSITTIVQTLKR